MSCDLDDCFTTVVNLAKQAGKIVCEASIKAKKITTKSSAVDLVTESDQEVERIIIGTLKEKYPDHKFIGEESVAAGERCQWTDDPTWIIDPIDGTMNFVHRFPFVGISIALTVNKKTVIGLIYNPIMEEMYTAREGLGAFCNGERLQVSGTEDIGQALICAEYGTQKDSSILDRKANTMRKVIAQCRGIRDMGSCSISMCYVAAGKADGYFHSGIHCWDYAAGDIIVKEAGGITRDPKGYGVRVLVP